MRIQEMETPEFERKKLEYQMAQEMLRHYDTLNWQIGGILIAAVIILTGLAVNEEIIGVARESRGLHIAIIVGIPLFSLFVLGVWLLWFKRHRELYNFRNEVLYRLEEQLGMYHFLRVVEANPPRASGGGQEPSVNAALQKAKTASGHDSMSFARYYQNQLARPSGYMLAKILVFGIPIAQFAFLCALLFALPAGAQQAPVAQELIKNGSAEDKVASNRQPLSLGKGQMTIDLQKVVWEPLKGEGIPPGVQLYVSQPRPCQ
jgi:hypothetical protein